MKSEKPDTAENRRKRGGGVRMPVTRTAHRRCSRGLRRGSRALLLSLLVLVLFLVCRRGEAQISILCALEEARAAAYNLYAIGHPPSSTPLSVEMGFINAANGDLHLEFPISSSTQRGALSGTASLIYDSRIWAPVSNGTSTSWQPVNSVAGGFSTGGWGFSQSASAAPAMVVGTSLNYCSQSAYTAYYGPFYLYEANGTERDFPIQTQQDFGCGNPNTSSGTASANDSSGYLTSVTNYTSAEAYRKNGALVFDDVQSALSAEDANGNYFTGGPGANLIDTLGRTPVAATTNGSTTYYDVLNAQGTTSRFTVAWENINVSTSFGVSGVTEFAGTISVIQSITLPDGTSYSFNYDSGTTPGYYGLMTSMTMRTGGTVTYGWTNFTDAYGNVNRWLDSRTSGGGTWAYTPSVLSTCTSTQVGCQQEVTETKPSGDEAVYTFTLNDGIWNTETDYYSGSSTLLKKITTTFDFSNSMCGGSTAVYIRPIQVNTFMPNAGSTLQGQTQYSYDSTHYGNVTAEKVWNYTTGGFGATPDRETDYAYLNSSPYISANILNRVTDKVTYQSGTKVAETQITYDSTGLTPAAGITHHDDTNYGAGNTVRGNPTVTSQWVSGSTYLPTTNYYDTTGQLIKTTDPAGNSTTYSYADNLYNDNGSNPPSPTTPSAPTNAYLTQETLPVSGTLSYGYYFGTGQQALVSDQNGAVTYQHYVDPLNRPTETYFPDGGWRLTNYTSATQTDVYTGLTSTSPSTSCSGCRHDETVLGGLGRVISQELVSDPDGSTTVATSYDTSGRVSTKSNPYRSTSDPTYGLETYAYDGLDRQTSGTLADNNVASTYYGASVTSGGGIGSQLCGGALGYPTLAVDEAGHKSETWTDVFGNTVEADEPDSTGALTLGTCYQYDALNGLTQVTEGSQTRTYGFDGLGRETSETTPEAGTVNYSFTNASGGLCAGNLKQVCRRTDARGITTTYTYDAESRLTSKSYSDGTPTANFWYDRNSATFGNWTQGSLTNTKGRLFATCASNAVATCPGGYTGTVYSYDAMGRVANFWQCTPYNCGSSAWQTTYTYDLAGDVTSWTHPAGFTVTNTVSNAQRITAITSSLSDSTHPGTLAASITYAPQGAVATLLDGCVGSGCWQVQETYDYNNRLQNVRIQLGLSNNTAVIACQVYNYYGNVSNPTSCAVPSQGTGDDGDVLGQYDYRAMDIPLSHTTSLTYDPTHRLTSAVATGNSTYNLTFTFDRYGNMTCQTNGQTQGPCPNYSFNSNTNQISTSGFTYDASGDLTNDSTHTYAYDAEGRLISVDNGATASYVYNPLGERVETSVGGTTTEYVFDTAGQPIGSRIPAWWQASYVNFQGRHLANYQGNEVYFNHVDIIGTTGIVTDYGGTLKQDELHYPWGQEWTVAGVMQEERFAKLQIRDPETELDPTHFRMYSSGVGRWMSPDAVPGHVFSPQSFNRYAYVLNNPANLIDPQGLLALQEAATGDGGGAGGGNEFEWLDLGVHGCLGYCGGQSGAVQVTTTVGGQAVSTTFGSWDQYASWSTGLASEPQNQAYSLFMTAAQQQGLNPNQAYAVSAYNQGLETNIQVGTVPLNTALLPWGSVQDPITFTHGGNASYFQLWSPFDSSHYVDSPGGFGFHQDVFGPLNPLHYGDWAAGSAFGQSPSMTFTCQMSVGCH